MRFLFLFQDQINVYFVFLFIFFLFCRIYYSVWRHELVTNINHTFTQSIKLQFNQSGYLISTQWYSTVHKSNSAAMHSFQRNLLDESWILMRMTFENIYFWSNASSVCLYRSSDSMILWRTIYFCRFIFIGHHPQPQHLLQFNSFVRWFHFVYYIYLNHHCSNL